MANEKHVFIIRENSRLRDLMTNAYRAVQAILMWSAVEVIIRPWKAKRSLDQNNKMWAMLTDISKQLQWVVDGRLQYIEPEEWKDILTAATAQELRVAQGINGGIVLLGRRTRDMRVQEMSDLIEVMNAFGAERGVVWKESPDHLVYRRAA